MKLADQSEIQRLLAAAADAGLLDVDPRVDDGYWLNAVLRLQEIIEAALNETR